MAEPDNHVSALAHPNAPLGGGGPGGFAKAGPLNSNPFKIKPSAQSPAGKSASSGGSAAPVSPPAPPPPAPRDFGPDLKDAAEKLIGQAVLGDGECYALADKLLLGAGAKSAPTFGKITDDANYVWGDKVELADVEPGNVLQFRNFNIDVKVDTKITRTWKENGLDQEDWKTDSNTQTFKRGHHTAVVTALNADGTLTIVEQHLTNRATGTLFTDIRQNAIPIRSIPAKTKTKTDFESDPVRGRVKVVTVETTTTTVHGTIWAYKATDQAPKPKAKRK